MNKNPFKYEAPFTRMVRVEMESGICASSQPGDPVNRTDGSRHVTINQQPTQSFDFSGDSWGD